MESTMIVTSTDGTKLHAQWWRSASQPPKACMVLIHGIHQSAELYRPGGCTPFVDRLNNVKTDVLAVDLRGFGRSATAGSFSVRSFACTFEEDVRAALHTAAAGVPSGIPLFCFGHSLGGLVAASLAISTAPPPEVDAYILSAPSVGAIRAPRAILGCIWHLLPRLPVSSMMAFECTNNADFARDFAAKAPSMPFTAAYVVAACKAIDKTRARFAHFSKPALILSGPPAPAGYSLHQAAKDGASGALRFDVHNQGDAPAELAAAITRADRVSCTYKAMRMMPHDLVFERRVQAAGGSNYPAVDAIVEYVAGFKK